MKKVLLATALVLSLAGGVLAQDTIKTGVAWDEERARTVALKHLAEEVDVSLFQGVDPHFAENRAAREELPSDKKIALRTVTYYSQGDYSVAYAGEPIVNYYQANGDLMKISICSAPYVMATDYSDYPRKCVDYTYPEGKVVSVSLDVSPVETFVFLPNGDLKNHWVGNKGYDQHNNHRWTRE